MSIIPCSNTLKHIEFNVILYRLHIINRDVSRKLYCYYYSCCVYICRIIKGISDLEVLSSIDIEVIRYYYLDLVLV